MWLRVKQVKCLYIQIDCSSSEDGIANLRRKYQSLIDANIGLEKTNWLLESKDEILEKIPVFTRDQIEVNRIFTQSF
jgi:hypothetical protein